MDKNQQLSGLRGRSAAVRRSTVIKKSMAVLLSCAGVAGLFLPAAGYATDTTLYSVTVFGSVFSHLVYEHTPVPFPIFTKLFALAIPVMILAGVVLLLCRRYKPAAACYGFGALSAAAWMLNAGATAANLTEYGARGAESSLLPGAALILAACALAAVLALWADRTASISETVFLLLACVSVGSVAFITFYMFIQGLPAIFQIGLGEFLFGTQWAPTAAEPSFGIAYMVLASLFGTAGAIVIGVPVGLMTAVFLAELAPRWVTAVVRPAVELLAGIPSVIYGFFGMRVVVPLLRDLFPGKTNGDSLLAVILILSIMILPTIVNVAENALRAVPQSYKEASLALGNTQIGTIFKVQIPAARSGILAGVILGVGRAIGETMAIIMVAGNIVQFPELLGAVRPLTSGITFEMGYATGLHRQALFGIGLVLFAFIMIINIVFNIISRKGATRRA